MKHDLPKSLLKPESLIATKRAILLLSAWLISFAGFAQTPTQTEIQKLLADDGAARDQFGISVSISGNTAIIGARLNDEKGTNSGAAYIYTFDGSVWTEQQKLIASDGDEVDQFGWSVSISGDIAIVGARETSDQTGSAYVFTFDGSVWTEQQKLTASDGVGGDQFGWSVSISGNTAIIGANQDDDRRGSAYIYRFNGSDWIEQQKLTAGDGEANDEFGFSVSVSGNTAIVGANRDDDQGSSSGSAYIYIFDGSAWKEQSKLTASDGAVNYLFGWSVSISGNTAFVGAPNGNFFRGSAYTYTFDGSSWAEQQKLTANDEGGFDQFGRSVSLSGNTAIVGAIGDNNLKGSAYIYTFDGSSWTEQQELIASDGTGEDFFDEIPGDVLGWSVSVSGNKAIAGAPFDDNERGSAYFFDVNVNEQCTPPVLASQDITVALDENGAASITAEQLLDEANSQIGCGYEPENLTISQSEFGCEDVGEVTVTLNLVDNNGNQASTTATVTIENPAPEIKAEDIQETLPVDPLLVNSSYSLSATITDVNAVSAVWAWENTTEMSSGSKEGTIENGLASVNLSLADPGLYTVKLTVTDVCGEEETYTYDGLVVVYDPSAGFVTGGGWIDAPVGSYTADPGLSGKANFGFVSKYKKDAAVPTGNLTFHFKPAKLKFKASSQEWLVISGDVAIFRGSGKIRGKKGVFDYLLVGKDQKPDAFRLMIWNEEEVVFDNQQGAAITDLMATQLGGGSIVIHQRNKNARSLDDEKPLAAQFSESPTEPGSFSFDYRSYPNPVLDEFNLHIQSETDEEVSFKVYDMMGRLLHESQHQVSKGANHLILNAGRWKQQKGKLLLQMESPSQGIRSINILKK